MTSKPLGQVTLADIKDDDLRAINRVMDEFAKMHAIQDEMIRNLAFLLRTSLAARLAVSDRLNVGGSVSELGWPGLSARWRLGRRSSCSR